MKYSIILLFLLASCKEVKKDGQVSTILKITLSDNLPFKSVKLKKFDPISGAYLPFTYNFSKEKDSFEFKLNISEPGFVRLFDENDIGVKDVFLIPGNNLSAEIFWYKQSIKMKISPGQQPDDNILFQSIHDSIDKLFYKIENTDKIFRQRDSINQYVETSFAQIVKPALNVNANLRLSEIFTDHVLKPRLALIKCYCKNDLIINSGHKNVWKKFYADSIFSNPNYKYWCEEYLEYGYFVEYLYEVINDSKADDLRTYIHNIQDFYSNKHDTLLTKIAISQGLISFSEKHSFSPGEIYLSAIRDSICTVHHLDPQKYNFPDLTIKELPETAVGLFNKIILEPVLNENEARLSDIINDTSKVYYIDYWASWCRPCVKALPYTVGLFNKKIPKLEVLFFSTDKIRKSFLGAVQKLKLPSSRSYNVIIKDETLDEYKKLNPISYIPVYQLIFFFNGSWRIMKATSAEDPSINAQIDTVLQSLKTNR